MRWPLAILLLSSLARADHEPEYQPLSATLDLAISVGNDIAERGSNIEALVTGSITWHPGDKINRWDVVHPMLRPFVRQPNALWLRAGRDGSNVESWTGAYGGGYGSLADGRVYGSAEVGIEEDEPSYDQLEFPYLTLPMRAEVGFRPTELVSVGATFLERPILGQIGDPPNQGTDLTVKRSGGDLEAGATVTFATADDRVLLTLRGGYHQARWSFDGADPGDTNVDGLRAGANLSFQATPTFSWIVTALFSREEWNDKRIGDSNPGIVPGPLDRIVYGASGTVGFVYWYRGQTGFHLILGGGYLGRRPLVTEITRGWGTFGFGVERRF